MTNQQCGMAVETLTHIIHMKTIQVNGKFYTNQTGGFPVQSSKGNKYVVIYYSYKSIDRSAEVILQAYQHVYTMLNKHSFCQQLHKLENEMSTKIETFIKTQQMQLQYSLDMHCTNITEWTNETWKNHFKASLASLP